MEWFNDESLFTLCSFSCPGGKSQNWLTTDGYLVTDKYQAEFDHGEFCVDNLVGESTVGESKVGEGDGNDLAAVMCNPCQEKVRCHRSILILDQLTH